MTPPSVDWAGPLRACAALPLSQLLTELPGRLPGVDRLEIWVWDQQRHNLVDLASDRTVAAVDVEEILIGRTGATIAYQGDEMGLLLVEGDAEMVSPATVESLAHLLGPVVRADRATGDLAHRRRRRRPMTLSAELQWSLLPPGQFRVADGSLSAAVEPAYEVGGDVYDYAFDGRNLFLAVLDARGHGLRSAMTVAVTVGAMRRARRAGADLATVAAEMAAAVGTIGDDGNFVSAVLASIDLETWTGNWLSAGHLPPLLATSGDVRELELTPALPLGVSIGGRSSEPVVIDLEVPVGGTLVLYSDGVVENMVLDDGRAVGDHRLHDALMRHGPGTAAPVMLHRAGTIVDELTSLTGPILRDDATLLVVDRLGGDPGPPIAGR